MLLAALRSSSVIAREISSSKGRGQATIIREKLTAAGMDPVPVILKIVDEWGSFADHMRDEAGWGHSVPTHPRLALIVDQLQEVANWYGATLRQEQELQEREDLREKTKQEEERRRKMREFENREVTIRREQELISEAKEREKSRSKELQEVGVCLSGLSGAEMKMLVEEQNITIDGFEKMKVQEKRDALTEYAKCNGKLAPFEWFHGPKRLSP